MRCGLRWQRSNTASGAWPIARHLAALLRAALSLDPWERPSAEEVGRHPWLSSLHASLPDLADDDDFLRAGPLQADGDADGREDHGNESAVNLARVRAHEVLVLDELQARDEQPAGGRVEEDAFQGCD